MKTVIIPISKLEYERPFILKRWWSKHCVANNGEGAAIGADYPIFNKHLVRRRGRNFFLIAKYRSPAFLSLGIKQVEVEYVDAAKPTEPAKFVLFDQLPDGPFLWQGKRYVKWGKNYVAYDPASVYPSPSYRPTRCKPLKGL